MTNYSIDIHEPVGEPARRFGPVRDKSVRDHPERDFVPGIADQIAHEVRSYVTNHPVATPYHDPAWLDAVREGYGHPGEILIARRDDNTIAGLLPLVRVGTPLGKPRLVSLPFCDLGGPLADEEDAATRLIDQARKRVSGLRARGLELRCAGAGQPLTERPGADSETSVWAGVHKVSMLCPLPDSAETLLASYKPKLRSQIRKAEKNGLTASLHVGEAIGDSQLTAFHAVYAANMRRLGSPAHSLGWFRAVVQAYDQQALLGLVWLNDTVVGVGLVLIVGDRAAIPWASTLADYNRLAPNMLLYWTLLAACCDRGCRQFDFGRSTPGEGTYRFKKQWGAEPRALNWQHWDATDTPIAPGLSGISGSTSPLRTLAELGWRALPLPVANALGPRLRRYITL